MDYTLEELEGELAQRNTQPWRLPRAERVHPELRSQFENLAADFYQQTGVPLRVTDSFRTSEEQADLYRRKPGLAVPAGRSRHEFGEALDIDQDQINKYGKDKWIALTEHHGFVLPALASKGEFWHIERPRFTKAEKIASTSSRPSLEALEAELASREQGQSGRVEQTDLLKELEAELARRESLEKLPEGPIPSPAEGAPEATWATGIGKWELQSAPAEAYDLFVPPDQANLIAEKVMGPGLRPLAPGLPEEEKDKYRMSFGEALMKNIRAFGRALIEPVRGAAKLSGLPQEMEKQKEKLLRKYGYSSYGPEGYGTEGDEGEESKGAVQDFLYPKGEKHYAGEETVAIPGNVFGAVASYWGPGIVARAPGVVPRAITNPFLRSLTENVLTFLPVDIGRGFEQAGEEGLTQALWHSPLTAALFTIGGFGPGPISRTAGVGLAGAGSAAAGGERDPGKLFESFATMAILHNMMAPGELGLAKENFKRWVKENKVTPVEIEHIKDTLAETTYNARVKEGQTLADDKITELEVKVEDGTATKDDLRELIVTKAARDREFAGRIYEAMGYPSTTEVEEVTVGRGKKARQVAAPVEQFPLEEKLTPASMEQIVEAAGRERQAEIEGIPLGETGRGPRIESVGDVEAAAREEALRQSEEEAVKVARPEAIRTDMPDVLGERPLEREAALTEEEGIVPIYGGGPDTSEVFDKARRDLAAELRVSPDKLEYKGIWKGEPGVTEDHYMFNVTDPEHPQYKSTAIWPVGEERYSGGPDTSDLFKSKMARKAAAQIIPKSFNTTEDKFEGIKKAGELSQTEPYDKFTEVVNSLVGGPGLLKPVGTEVPRSFRFLGGKAIDPKVGKGLEKDITRIEKDWMSYNIVSANRFGIENNPINDFMTGNLTYLNNRVRFEGWLNNLVREHGLADDVAASEKALAEQLGPVFDEFLAVKLPQAEIRAGINNLKNQLKKFNPKTQAAKNLKAEIAELEEAEKSMAGEPLEDIYKKRSKVLSGLKKEYANIRIKLAAGGDQESLDLLSPTEREIMRKTRDYYDKKKSELQEQGLRTIKEDYVNFVFNHALSENDPGAAAFVDNLWWFKRRKPTPVLLDFISRTPGSKDWFPLWFQSLNAYMPSVERKLAFNPFLTKWTPEVSKWNAKGYTNAANWLTEFIKKNFSAESKNDLDKVVNSLINIEYARTLVANLSPPVLHLFKLFQTLAWHGPAHTAKGLGRFDKGLAQKALSLEGPERQLLDYYLHLPSLVRAIEQQPGMEKALQPSFWRRLGTGLTTLIEYFDNGVNLIANMEKAISRGATPGLIHQSSLDTLMRLNFRGFTLPRVATGTVGRTISMYMGQPMKLLENKADLLWKSLTGKRDEFGDLYITKAICLATILGALYAAGDYAGLDLHRHILHLPGVGPAKETGEESVTGFFTPPMQLGYEMATKGPAGVVNHFLDVPAIARALNILEDEIPERFDDNPWLYAMNVPKVGWKEEMKERKEWRQFKEQKQHPWRDYYSKPPLRRWLDDVLDR